MTLNKKFFLPEWYMNTAVKGETRPWDGSLWRVRSEKPLKVTLFLDDELSLPDEPGPGLRAGYNPYDQDSLIAFAGSIMRSTSEPSESISDVIMDVLTHRSDGGPSINPEAEGMLTTDSQENIVLSVVEKDPQHMFAVEFDKAVFSLLSSPEEIDYASGVLANNLSLTADNRIELAELAERAETS